MITTLIQSILNRQTSTLSNPQPWLVDAFGGAATASGQVVNADNALQVASVWSAVRVLSESVASIPLVLYERLPNGGKRPAVGHPLFGLLHRLPNSEMTSFDLRQLLMVMLLLRGNSYHQIIRDGLGRVIGIWPLHPDRMQLFRSETDGQLIYRYYPEKGEPRNFSPFDIWRSNGLGGDGIVGYSPITLHRETLGLSMATRDHAARLFSNGAQVGGVLQYDGELSPEGRNNLTESFSKVYAGSRNAHKVPLLEHGVKFEKLSLSNEDSQFIQSRKFDVNEVARIFNVPPHMIGDLEKASFSNIEQQSLNYVIYSVTPWLVRVEQSADRDLLSPAERGKYFFEFLIEGLLRGDSKTRAEFYKTAIQTGWMNRNEVRRKENMNPARGLDEFLIPLNMERVGQRNNDQRRVESITKAAARRIVTKEVNGLQKILEKQSQSGLAAGIEVEVSRFFQDHSKFVQDVLNTDPEFASRYSQGRYLCLARKTPEEMPAELERWRWAGPDQLTNLYLSREDLNDETQIEEDQGQPAELV